VPPCLRGRCRAPCRPGGGIGNISGSGTAGWCHRQCQWLVQQTTKFSVGTVIFGRTQGPCTCVSRHQCNKRRRLRHADDKLADLVLWKALLSKAHLGISTNLIVACRPRTIVLSNSCLFGIGAWLPPQLRCCITDLNAGRQHPPWK
jgi:hypothetical protein